MTERGSSRTALGAATLRAVHQLLDATPKILDDPVIPRLLDPSVIDRIRNAPDEYRTPSRNALRSHIVTRSRYAEDRLAEAMQRGVRQHLILGAGLDTFAYRQAPWAQALRIFEVDHPASQHAKRERLARSGITVPPNLEFVSIDFEAVSLRDGLGPSSFDCTRPAFLSWLGVMIYLSAEAIDAVFRFAASLPPSSEIVFTFAPPESADETSPAYASMAARAKAYGEPWRTRVAPDELIRQLSAMGFSTVHVVTPAEIDARYIRDREDGLRAPRRSRIARAIV